jgi:LytS/YehU family sensor histidine kinase
MIARLGDFLRVTIESSATHLVSLDEEIRFLKLYFEIEEARVGDRVRLLVQIDPATASVLVPNLILQPLVENALRHGAWQQTRRAV